MFLVLAGLLLGIQWAGTRWERTRRQARLDDALITCIRSRTPADVKQIRLLLAQGANPNAKGPKDVLALSWTADYGDVAAMRTLLDAGADPNCRDGWLPALGQAAHGGNIEAVKLLLERGADPNDDADGGSWALELARSAGHPAVVRLLRAHGAREPVLKHTPQ